MQFEIVIWLIKFGFLIYGLIGLYLALDRLPEALKTKEYKNKLFWPLLALIIGLLVAGG